MNSSDRCWLARVESGKRRSPGGGGGEGDDPPSPTEAHEKRKGNDNNSSDSSDSSDSSNSNIVIDTHLGTGEVLRGVPLVADHPTPRISVAL